MMAGRHGRIRSSHNKAAILHINKIIVILTANNEKSPPDYRRGYPKRQFIPHKKRIRYTIQLSSRLMSCNAAYVAVNEIAHNQWNQNDSPENMNSRALFYCLNSVHDTTEFQTISKATPSAVHLSDICPVQRGISQSGRICRHTAVNLRVMTFFWREA